MQTGPLQGDEIDISALPPGLYLLRIIEHDTQKVFTGKIIKQ